MKTSIATVSISGSLAEKITAISRGGFDGLEIFENDLVASPLSIAEIRSSVADHGLTIDLYQPFRDFEGVSTDQLAKNLERAKNKFDVMKQLGVSTILVCSNVASAIEQNDALFIEQLGELANLAESHEIQVAYEALAWGKYVSTYEHAWRLVESVNNSSLGICLDSFHILSRGSSLELISEIPGDRISYLQLADAPQMSLDVLSWSRHHRLFPGEGSWNLADFVNRVIDAGYRGPLSLEVFNDVYRQTSPSATALDGHRSLLNLESEIALLRAGKQQDSIELAKLPDVQSPTEVVFAELSPGEGTDLADALAALGFTRIGRHSRKPVELWGSGSARIVLNFGKSNAEVELTNICLEYPSTEALMKRVTSLHYQSITRDLANAESEFGIVLAPNGIEFQISDASSANWQLEFGPTLQKLGAAGITAIDHVSLMESWTTADQSSLFFRAGLGLQLEGELDLASEVGLVRSRSASNSDRSVRVALNLNPEQLPSRLAANHIAFASEDIFETANHVRQHQLGILAVPQNYYQDLWHRTGLDQAFIERLSSMNILYDSDAAGSFLHFYTEQIGKVFFEVVQRVGEYDGYGAYNSFVRLASLRAGQGRRP